MRELSIVAAAREGWDAPALVFGDEIWSWVELARRVTAEMAALGKLGLGQPGGPPRARLVVRATPETVVRLLALVQLGVTVVPLHARWTDGRAGGRGGARPRSLGPGQPARGDAAQPLPAPRRPPGDPSVPAAGRGLHLRLERRAQGRHPEPGGVRGLGGGERRPPGLARTTTAGCSPCLRPTWAGCRC